MNSYPYLEAIVSRLPFPEGERNISLYRVGQSLRRKGRAGDDLLSDLLYANQCLCIPMLPPDEVRSISRSVDCSDQELGANGFLGQSASFPVRSAYRKLLPAEIKPACGRTVTWDEISKLPCTLYMHSRCKMPYQQTTIAELLTLFVSGNYPDGLSVKAGTGGKTVAERIMYAREMAKYDKEAYQRYKSTRIPAAILSGTSETAHKIKCITPNGLLCFDIDTPIPKEELMQTIAKIPYAACCFQSVSGTGWAGFTFSETLSIGDHFLAVQAEFKKYSIAIDAACKDLSRLRYVTISPVYKKKKFKAVDKE